MTADKPVITAQRVHKRERLRIIPKRFGRLRTVIENMLYAQLTQLTTDYRGGWWTLYQLSNGGFYMAPNQAEKLHLYITDNYFEGILSADAAGIVACLLVFNQLNAKTDDDYFEQLERHRIEYATSHPEAELILNAIE